VQWRAERHGLRIHGEGGARCCQELGVHAGVSAKRPPPSGRLAGYHATAPISTEDAGPLRRLPFAAPIAAVALVYAATLVILPPGGLWVVDNGNKRIQVEALLASGFRDFSLPWPGRELDPELAFNPLPRPFSVVREGRLYSVFSPVFPLLSALPFRVLGDAGLCLLPLLASLALLGFAGRIADLAGFPPHGRALAILVAGLATPLWFYAVIFWEHAVAASLCLASVALAFEYLIRGSKRRLLLSGLVMALAAGLRDPLLLFAVVLGALVFFATPQARLRTGAIFAAGVVAGLLPLALFQWLALGDPLGFHLTHGFAPREGEETGLGFLLRTRPAVLHNLLLASGPGVALSALLAGPFALLLLVRPRLPDRAYRGVALAVAAWALAGATLLAVSHAMAASPIRFLMRSNGFFAAAPLLAIGLLRRREPGPATASDRVVGWLLGLVAGYSLLYLALTPVRNTTGVHWGNRYLLELYPLLAVPCAAGLLGLWRGWRAARLASVLLALLAAGSVALQVFSIDLLRRKLVFGENFERAVREQPQTVVITSVWWVPQTLAREFFEKKIFYVPTLDEYRILSARLVESGVGEFLLVTADSRRRASPRARVIEDEGLGFFSLRIEPHTLSGR
jgi:hypothetical protein